MKNTAGKTLLAAAALTALAPNAVAAPGAFYLGAKGGFVDVDGRGYDAWRATPLSLAAKPYLAREPSRECSRHGERASGMLTCFTPCDTASRQPRSRKGC